MFVLATFTVLDELAISLYINLHDLEAFSIGLTKPSITNSFTPAHAHCKDIKTTRKYCQGDFLSVELTHDTTALSKQGHIPLVVD